LFRSLNKNIEINKLRNIETHNFGLSEQQGSFDFYFDPSLSVNASLLNVSDKNQIENIKCHVKKLDDYIEEKNITVGFIKCDVEGAELLVFKGGIKLIERDTPIVFTEMLRKYASKFSYHPNDIISFYDKLGYLCFVSKNKNLFRFERVEENTTETNYFFLHREKHSEQIKRFVNT
jgi:FkbM family methyltransferase